MRGTIAATLTGLFGRLRRPRVRIATFNTALSRPEPLGLARELAGTAAPQARKIAEIIQRIAPDIVLLNEFDYDSVNRAARLFLSDYLAVAQRGASPCRYPYLFSAPVNTGVPSGFDLDGDGREGPGDALGFGHYPGHYGMLLLSRFPIAHGAVRTFQHFRWRDMPGALLPRHPDTGVSWYPDALLEYLPLSSKSHWDVPVRVGRRTLHILASHPTPPVFDGRERRNQRRNHDEIRFWTDYLDGADYIYDDEGKPGGLDAEAAFVLLGDLNADPELGDGLPGAIAQLLDHPRVQARYLPRSTGGATKLAPERPIRGEPAAATADFGRVGRLRVDYVLPSTELRVHEAGVFWPPPDDPLADLITPPGASSDHRLVWADVK